MSERSEGVNCPIREFTADWVPVGRCWFHLSDGKTCPRHGDVGNAVRRFNETGRLTDDTREAQVRRANEANGAKT